MGEEKKKLLWALTAGDLDEVKSRVLTSGDANRELDGRMPLHYAADYGHKELLEFLMSMDAKVNVLDKHGLTPLTTACLEGHQVCAKLLLDKGADKTLKAECGVNALEAAESDAIKALLQ